MDSSDKVNCIPKCGIGLKIEEEEAIDSDKIENKKKEEDGIEVNIKTEEIILEDFKLESEPDPSAGCSNQLNWTDPTMGHVVFLPPIKSEMLSEESDPDQDEDFNLNCEVVLGDCEVTKDKEGETVVKNEPTSSDSYTASGSLQESKISHGQGGGDHNPSEEEVKTREPKPVLRVIDGRKTYCCHVCPYKTTHCSHMKKHLNTHTGYKPYKCRVCLHSFSQAVHLKSHMDTHIGQMPHKCTFCSYRSSRARNLKAHVATHTGLKPFKCDKCSFSSSRADDLKRHSMTHTQDKPFTCTFCDYKTVRKNHLTLHLRVHSGDKPFHCSQCSYKCSQKPHLKIHLARRHSAQTAQ